MPAFTVTIALTVHAEDATHACGLGRAAADHLAETFNDDESLTGTAHVQVRPARGEVRPALAECLVDMAR